MAEPQKVSVQASRIDASILPPGFSQAYRLYVIQQGGDLKNIADASNSANDLAYQATVKNGEQDKILDDHDSRLTSIRTDVDNHESRITNNSKNIESLGGRVSSTEQAISGLSKRVGSNEEAISSLKNDYVSQTTSTLQTLASPLGIANSLSINGTKILGAQQTGFTAATGTAYLGAFNADDTYSAFATYTQSQQQAVFNSLREARRRIKALEDALRAHGLIN